MINAAKKSQGLLSVCMIAKNEENIIARAIDSISSISDEIIVVDTGSTDKTCEIAKKHGARVINSDWKNDFAYSRNISIKEATCKWILWLDADDFVPKESLPQIRELVKKAADRVYATVVKNMRPDKTGTSFMQARFFPNFKGVYFERPIHEQMMISALKLGLTLHDTPIVINHLGYIEPELLKSKATRNCELLLKEYEKNGTDPFMLIEIADSYTIMQEDKTAFKWYKKLLKIKNVESRFADLAGQALLGLGNISNRREEFEEAKSYLLRCIKISPNRPDARYSLAISLDLSGKKEEAVEVLLNILDMKEVNSKVGIDHRLSKVKSYGRLFTILSALGKKDLLIKLSEKAEVDFPERADIRNHIGRALFYCGKLIESLKQFEQSISIQKHGNIAAFIGLIIIYVKADKNDIAKSTAQNILPQFGEIPAFHAICYMYNLLSRVDLKDYSVDNEEVEFEKERILEYYRISTAGG